MMRRSNSQEPVNKVVVVNPKGGCGKSTIATNIAACYAARGETPAIMDFDPQGSTLAWLDRRPADAAPIHGIAAFRQSMQVTRSWQLRLPTDTTNLVVDSPASMNDECLRQVTQNATSILVPVLPSPMDIHAASRCIADLLLVAKVDRNDRKLAVVANRTRKNTKSLSRLMRFVDSLGIPIIAVLRDSQNFVHAADEGCGVIDLPPSRVRPDVEQLENVMRWLDTWPERRAVARTVTGIRNKAFSKVSFLRKSQAESA